MTPQPNRIYFPGNPYPNGHSIKEFLWRGRMDEDESLWFDFHLKSDSYYAEDENRDEEDDAESDWTAKGGWENYHDCTLSSTYWPDPSGLRIDTKGQKIDFDRLIQKGFIADPLPLKENFELDDLSFHIYLLGHDSCADHKIKISGNQPSFDIEWTGKIALSYAGDYEFKYDFIALIHGVRFDGFHYPKSWTLEKATEVFNKKLENFDQYEFVDLNPKSFKREYKLNRIGA